MEKKKKKKKSGRATNEGEEFQFHSHGGVDLVDFLWLRTVNNFGTM
jgi:hypothetical protein